jgi:hypothetical protein
MITCIFTVFLMLLMIKSLIWPVIFLFMYLKASIVTNILCTLLVLSLYLQTLKEMSCEGVDN